MVRLTFCLRFNHLKKMQYRQQQRGGQPKTKHLKCATKNVEMNFGTNCDLLYPLTAFNVKVLRLPWPIFCAPFFFHLVFGVNCSIFLQKNYTHLLCSIHSGARWTGEFCVSYLCKVFGKADNNTHTHRTKNFDLDQAQTHR